MTEFDELSKVEELADHCAYQSALKNYNHLLERFPQFATFICYNQGELYHHFIGDAVKARELYQQAANYAEDDHNGVLFSGFHQHIRTFIYENMMLLSLGFDEYFRWAEKLARLAPASDILINQLPSVQEMDRNGIYWLDVLFWMTRNYQDAGRHGDAATMFHLIIMNRVALRTNDQKYRDAMKGFGTARLWVYTKCGLEMEEAKREVKVEEFEFIAIETMEILNSYLHDNPNDKEVVKIYQDFKNIHGKANHGNVNENITSSYSPIHPDSAARSRASFLISISLTLSLFLVIWVAYRYELTKIWQLILAVLAGVFIVVPLFLGILTRLLQFFNNRIMKQ